MAANMSVSWERDGDVRIQQKKGDVDAVQRFRDLREDMRDRMPFEVTNEFVLNYILDVHDLHWEREGR